MPARSRHTTSKRSQCENQSGSSGASAIAIARYTNGKLRPSFKPASDVRAKRTSSSVPVSGGPTWTSLASTGSVGARQAARRMAEAAPSPSIQVAPRAITTIPTGITRPRSLQVSAQLRRPTRRSIFNPAPMSATMTVNSVMRSMTRRLLNESNWAIGLKMVCPTSMPMTMQKIGSESGSRRKAVGIQAVNSTTAPNNPRAIW